MRPKQVKAKFKKKYCFDLLHFLREQTRHLWHKNECKQTQPKGHYQTKELNDLESAFTSELFYF